MFKLSEFFLPLNFVTLFYFLITFIFFDALGTFVLDKFLKFKSTGYRIVNWLVGFGVFVFTWFCLSLVISPGKTEILTSVALLSIVVLPNYFLNKKFISFFTELWENKLALLIILPLLPAVFVKASLPPYYGDEMAYHYIAPSALRNIEQISYVGGLYADLPRILNFFWQQVFTVFKTYSIARLFHFTILASSMVYAYGVLKKNFSLLVGLAFVFIFFSLPQDIVLTSTLGYIDVGAYSFLLIGLVSALDFLVTKKTETLILSFIFWAMNLGTKYTGVSSFVVFFFSISVYLFIFKKEYKNIFKSSLFVKLLISLVLFGGYWYIKNFILYGNPIFPFIFNCWGTHVEVCPALGGFFGDWTTKITAQNIPLIVKSLLAKNYILQITAVVSPLLLLFAKNKKSKFITLMVFTAVVVELLILKYFSGFYVRYQQHLQFYLIFTTIISLTSDYKNKIVFALSRITLVLVLLSSIYTYFYVVRNTNSLRFLNWDEINYSTGKIDIYQWINIKFPTMNNVIKWCEESPDNQVRNLARFDPDLIWFDHEGLMRSFTTNCDYVNPPLHGVSPDKVAKVAIDQKLQFWIASTNKCLPFDKVVPKYTYERPDMLELRKLNNAIICNSSEVSPNLYYFDYQKVKPK